MITPVNMRNLILMLLNRSGKKRNMNVALCQSVAVVNTGNLSDICLVLVGIQLLELLVKRDLSM